MSLVSPASRHCSRQTLKRWRRITPIVSIIETGWRTSVPSPWEGRLSATCVAMEDTKARGIGRELVVAFRGVIRLFRRDSKSQGYRSNTTAEEQRLVGGTSIPRPTMLDCHFQYLSPSCWTGHVYPSMVARRGICRPLLSPISSLFVLVIHLI